MIWATEAQRAVKFHHPSQQCIGAALADHPFVRTFQLVLLELSTREDGRAVVGTGDDFLRMAGSRVSRQLAVWSIPLAGWMRTLNWASKDFLLLLFVRLEVLGLHDFLANRTEPVGWQFVGAALLAEPVRL